MLREIPGVPQIYIKRSVMILEPMATESIAIRTKEEKSKFRDGLVRPERKRKRGEDEDDDESGKEGKSVASGGQDKKSHKKKGPKGPNPLAVKKSKKATEGGAKQKTEPRLATGAGAGAGEGGGEGEGEGEGPAKKKRRRRQKNQTGDVESGAPATQDEATAEQAAESS
ncbi:hypothetical protein CH063_06558 [Colletotrichum higginsianum]|nr:hypothetical protein CH063_06558 [Colletotrichum higginsianum]